MNKLLASDGVTAQALADALLVSVEAIEEFRRGREMSLERQLLLATFAVEHGSRLARLGHRLRGQIRAAIAYSLRESPTHVMPPPPRYW